MKPVASILVGVSLFFAVPFECVADIVYDPSLGTLPEAQGWSFFERGENPLPVVSEGVLHQTATADASVQQWFISTEELGVGAERPIYIEVDLKVDSSDYREFSSPDRWRAGYGLVVQDENDHVWIAAITSTGLRMTNSINWLDADSTAFYDFDTTSASNVYRLVQQDDTAELSVNGSPVLTLPAGDSITGANWESSSARFGDLSVAGASETDLSYVRLGTVPQPVNLLLNGSFEETGDLTSVIDPATHLPRDPAPTIPPSVGDPFYVLPDASTAIAHWEVEIDPVLVNPNEPEATVDWVHTSHYTASDGEQSVDLNGTPGPGGIKQSFETIYGATYDLQFDLAGNPVGNGLDPQLGLTEDKIKYLRVELECNGVVFDSREFTFDVTGKTAEDVGWITEGWSFKAVGSETTLRFKSLAWSVDGDSGDALTNLLDFGPTIDNVCVYQAMIPGDLNGDGIVDGQDLDIVRAHWGETVPAGDRSMGDAGGDGYVSSDDLDWVRLYWGQGVPPAAAVPEPGLLVLLTVGLSCFALRRRAV